MVYFIADTHFGHTNVLRFCERPFADIEEMNEILVSNWNRKVHKNDTVYVVGDMFYRCAPETVEEILSALKGRKKLVVGNHDYTWMGKVDAEKYFDEIALMMEGTDGQHGFTVCHYPMLSWRKDSKNYMIYGHIHNDVNLDFWPLLAQRERALNAGVDINGYAPVTIDEMISYNNAFKKRWKEWKEAGNI